MKRREAPEYLTDQEKNVCYSNSTIYRNMGNLRLERMKTSLFYEGLQLYKPLLYNIKLEHNRHSFRKHIICCHC